MKIIYAPTLPAEVRTAVEPLLERHRSIVPEWCHRLTIYFTEGGNNGEYSAGTSVDWPYRKASITLHAGFLTDPPDVRERDIVHELFHVVTGPGDDFAWRELKRVLDTAGNETLVKAMRAAYKDHVEGTVQDLCNLYMTGRLSHPATAARIEV